MREVFDMWRNTRMVVLAAVSASLYAAILIPFKVLPIIPGVTEFRPANAVPVVCSFLFGPAGAWGAALGNVIGDFFGGIGPGDLFGFVGNFLYGLIPYKVWEAISSRDPVPDSPLQWIKLCGVIILSSAVCSLTISWGIHSMGFVPFPVLSSVILINNGVVACVLVPFLLRVIYPRVAAGRLLYRSIIGPRARRPRGVRMLGVVLVVVATVGGLVLGNAIASGSVVLPCFPLLEGGQPSRLAVGVGLVPLFTLLGIGIALL